MQVVHNATREESPVQKAKRVPNHRNRVYMQNLKRELLLKELRIWNENQLKNQYGKQL